jgi:hypothetical protein
MSKWIRTAFVMLAVVLASLLAVVEFNHRLKFGHFVPLTLHADYSIAKVDIGIPGISKLYDAHITNFGIFPRRIERCEFISDDCCRTNVSVGYHLQQWDKSTRLWRTVLAAESEYCRPYPLAIIQARLTTKWLWPGQTLSTGEEATGARGNLQGETMRFVVVANGREFPTAGFTIDEHVESSDVDYRVRH